MTYITSSFQEFISHLEGFEQLPPEEITHLSKQLQAWRYRIGQKIIGKEKPLNKLRFFTKGKCGCWDTIPKHKYQLH